MHRTKTLVLGCILLLTGCGSMPMEADTAAPPSDSGTPDAGSHVESDASRIVPDVHTVTDTGTNCGDALLCNGVCVAADERVHNCGACGVECCGANTTVCGCSLLNACIPIQCAPGFADCDGNTSNGCETDTTSDPENCGGCGVPRTTTHRCQGFGNGMCSQGRCVGAP